MMKTKIFYQFLLMLVLVFSAAACHAQTISSEELINNAKKYDGKIVTYRGEVVGDVMVRGDNAWINLNDGYVAIGVFARKTDIEDISNVGSYRSKGDVIEVTGIFNRSCPEHGGDLDIHAQEIKEIVAGETIPTELSIKKFYIALILTLVSILLYFISKNWCRGRELNPHIR